jgi:hypothetical protein
MHGTSSISDLTDTVYIIKQTPVPGGFLYKFYQTFGNHIIQILHNKFPQKYVCVCVCVRQTHRPLCFMKPI